MKHPQLFPTFSRFAIVAVSLFWALWASLSPIAAAQDGQRVPLLLDDQRQVADAWPHVSLLFDEQKTLTIDEVMARSGANQPKGFAPASRYATLGARNEAVWLRIALKLAQTASSPHARWVADIDFPVLNEVDFYLTRNGSVVQSAQMGNLQPFESRPLASRSHAMPLELEPTQSYELFIRVETRGPMILPLKLSKEIDYQERALGEQMLQGLLLGVGVCLVLYSLAQGLIMREPLFIKYTVLVTGTVLFLLVQFGIGAQFIWTNNFWLEQHLGSLSGLIAVCGSYLFIEQALSQAKPGRFFGLFMKGGAALCGLLALLYAVDVLSTSVVTKLISVLAFVPVIVASTRAIYLARHRDLVGIYFLVAWLIYTCFTLVFVGVLQGRLPVNFWTLHAYQFGSIIEMLAFMLVLSLRAKAIRLAANRANQERDIMRSLAHTDALTGLANRRRLDEALHDSVVLATRESLLAVYVIDIDGFKPVNDQYGHDTGDELLIAIARRLQANMRGTDLLARFGGDEFVVLAQSLANPQQAHELGIKLISVFDEPFALQKHTAKIGLTIGYAIGPQDAQDATTLLKLADAAMYQGKQDGKHCLRRAQAAIQHYEAQEPNTLLA